MMMMVMPKRPLAQNLLSPSVTCRQAFHDPKCHASPPQDPIQETAVGRSALSISWLCPGVGDDDDDDGGGDAKEAISPTPAPQRCVETGP